MELSNINDILQNKNFVMFISACVFMMGILTSFSHAQIVLALIFTILLILTFAIKIFSIKRVLILLFLFYFGFTLSILKVKTSDELVVLAPANVEISGRISDIPTSIGNNKIRFILKVETVNNRHATGKTLVTIEENNHTSLDVGEKIKLNGNLRVPFKSTNPSQFDYSAYLKNFNVFTVFYAEEGAISKLEDTPNLKWKLLNKLNKIRNDIIKIHARALKSPNLEILGGIVFGDDAVSPPDYVKTSFINSGLLHILAASGMNVGFIFLFWEALLKLFKIPFRIRIISGMGMVILYTLMTGLGASVIRAALMLIFVLCGKLIDRDAHSVSLLSLVAVIMLIYNPAFINDVSFQLSFFVTFGLLTTAESISAKIKIIPDWIKYPIIIPIIAQIWVIPIQMFYFNTISVYSIFANIASASVLSIISFAGFLSSILAIIPAGAIICNTCDFALNYLLTILIEISKFFGSLPHCIIQTTHPNVLQIIIYYLMLITCTYLIKHSQIKKAVITVFIIAVILLLSAIRIPSKALEIIAFDVQNADCFLIKTPQNKYFFIDTGKAPYNSGNSQAKIIMLKYLKDRGIKNIEGVIITHFDNDHSGGAVDIAENTNVKKLYLNSQKTDTLTSKNIFKFIKENHQEYTLAKNNDIIYKEQDLKIKTYQKNISGKDESNASSIVTLLSYKDFDMLFMGDAGSETYEKIKNYLPQNIEILKVGHHGGHNVVTKEMLDKLGIKVSLISTGLNYFGHPNKGTLDILRNTYIIRTDYLNSIKISTDGNQYNIYSYNPQVKKYTLRDIFKTVK